MDKKTSDNESNEYESIISKKTTNTSPTYFLDTKLNTLKVLLTINYIHSRKNC